MERLIKRVIIEDSNRICIVNSPLDKPCTIEQLKAELTLQCPKKQFFYGEIDTVGTILIQTAGSLKR